ncbi:hypothetical protein [Streptomyces sp. NPDC058739]|uniref:hypothetical protein n=1 Tax=Streptomyces sp. NPDC058739 TaxID=3346618 RepID=UPI0036C31685
MTRRFKTAAPAVAALTALRATAGAAPQATAHKGKAPIATVKAECRTKYKVIGRNVAVRHPAWDYSSPVVTPRSPVVR